MSGKRSEAVPSSYYLLYELTLFLQLAVRLPHAWKHGKAKSAIILKEVHHDHIIS
jgi:hypothetical protein